MTVATPADEWSSIATNPFASSRTFPRCWGTRAKPSKPPARPPCGAPTFLVDGNDGGVSAYDLAQVAGDAIDRCQKELHAATGVLERVGDLIDNIKIPSIEPNYSELMGSRW